MENFNINKGKMMLLPGLAGTSAMTVFSYIVSEFKDKNFREPQILAQLIFRFFNRADKPTSNTLGWTLHYLTGVVFAISYEELWSKKILNPNLKSAIILGGTSGLIGILVWRITLKSHPRPPARNPKRYFAHLFLAHIVFGIFTTLCYRLLKDDKKPRTLHEG